MRKVAAGSAAVAAARDRVAEALRLRQERLRADREMLAEQAERRAQLTPPTPPVPPTPALDLASWKRQDYAAYEASQQQEALQQYRASEHASIPAASPAPQTSWWQRALAAPFTAAHSFVTRATPWAQTGLASAVGSIGGAITFTGHNARMALGWEPRPEGVTRWQASAEAVYGLGNLVTLGALGDVRYGIQNRDWLRVGLGAIGLIPGVKPLTSLGRSASRPVIRAGSGLITKVDDLIRLNRGARVAVGHVDEAVRAARSGWLYHPTVGQSLNLPAGTAGVTNKYGDILVRPGLSPLEHQRVLLHESVHSFFSPRIMLLREARAKMISWLYSRSHLFRYLEEGLAEGYAQVKLQGLPRGIIEGVRYPLAYDYGISPLRLIVEATGGGLLINEVLQTSHALAEQWAEGIRGWFAEK
jgi:hypothetical protein